MMMKKAFLLLLAALLLTAGCAGTPAPPLTADAEASLPAESEPKQDEATAAPVSYTDITITVRRDAETVSERAVTDEAEVRLVKDIVFDSLVKSAAWEGIEASELEDCIILSFALTGDAERQSWYQYDTEGKHALQMGEAGRYTIMGGDAFDKLMALAGLAE